MISPLLITVGLLAVVPIVRSRAYLSESWSMIASSHNEHQSNSKCVPIPSNLTLCRNIQYTEMQLPNLLDHENLAEVVHHSQDWLSLLNLNCNPHTQLFLCSVFAPVCLPEMAKPILPCRSLCEHVKNGCEGRMQQYGFPWPDMLRCSQYPEENDMCIKPPEAERMTSSSGAPLQEPCESCTQVGTYENIIDNFCRSAVVMKARISEIAGSRIRVRNGRSLKKGEKKRSVGEKVISLSASGACPCELKRNSPSHRYLIMANKDGEGNLIATLILPWQKEGDFKRAVHQFSRVNCKLLGREIRASASRRPNSLYALRKHNPPSNSGY